MTRYEYLDELNTHLMSLSAEERENAVKFYEEYFEDAGPDKEQEVIEELGKFVDEHGRWGIFDVSFMQNDSLLY